MKPPRYDFSSDNTAGICPEALAALAAANTRSARSYGGDDWTVRAAELMCSVFETACDVFFVSTGTAANALALAACCPEGGIVCHESAHILLHECRASEFFSGGRLRPVPGSGGKLGAAEVARALAAPAADGSPRPRAISLTQSTELGTVYTAAETAAVAAEARKHGLTVHMDGARFANAAAALADRDGTRPADLAWRAGVDVLSFGGIKNGLAEAEAIVFFNRELARDFSDRQIRAGQRSSKMRFQSAQWIGLLEDGAWLRNARQANAMARRLADGLSRVPGVTLAAPAETSAVFAAMPPPLAAGLRARGWDVKKPGSAGHRFRCSWATQAAEVESLLADFQSAANSA